MSIQPAIDMVRSPGGRPAEWAYLHSGQMIVHKNPSRFKVVVAGRRWGKTQLAKVEIIARAKTPRQLIWYIAPTYQMARQIMWQELIDAIPRRWVKRTHETWMVIFLVNGTIIQLKGADKPDALRGVGLNFVVLDEFQDMREETWTKVIRPTLSSTRGEAVFIGTPKSFNHLYDVYMMGQREDTRATKSWSSWQFPTKTSPFIPADEIEAARADMDEKSFRQEFEASFETMSNRVYYAFDRNVNVKRCGFDPNRPIWVGMDFNIDPMSAIFMQPYENHVKVFGEKVIYNSNTEEMAQALDKQFWRHQKQITIYPDPAGNNRGHQRGESDLQVLRTQGFKRMKFRRKHPLVRDRVNAVNSRLRAANGDVRLYIDPACTNLINSLEQTQYKPGGNEINKADSREHETDALGYPIELEFPLKKKNYLGLSI